MTENCFRCYSFCAWHTVVLESPASLLCLRPWGIVRRIRPTPWLEQQTQCHTRTVAIRRLPVTADVPRNAKIEKKINKKLSYCRDSAGRRSLRRLWSFKVNDFGTNRKPVCDFLLVNNTNFHHIPHHLPYSSVLIKLSLLTAGASL